MFSKHPLSDRRSTAVRPNSIRGLISAFTIVALVMATSGCTSDPQVPAIAPAATVGEAPVAGDAFAATVTAVQAVQTRVLAGKTGNALQPDEIGRLALTQQIQHLLLEKVNTTLPDPVSDADVAAVVGTPTATAIADRLLVPEADLPARIKDVLVLTELVKDAITSKTPVREVDLKISMVTYPTREEARKQEQLFLQNPQTFTDMVDSGIAGRTDVQISLHTDPAQVPSGVFSLPVGAMTVLTSGESSLVARIDQNTVTAAPIAGDVDLTDVGLVQGFGSLLLAAATKDVTVEVDPEFGNWDLQTAQVVPLPGTPG